MKTELNVIQSIIKNQFRIIQYPAFITFIVTWRCNSKCIFCDVWKKKDNGQEDMNVDEIAAFFKQLKPIDVIRITGGEPFLRKDLHEIINTINKLNNPGMIHLTTNGFLTEQIIDTINKIENPEKIHIKVSIDGIGYKHDKTRNIPGAYKKAMATLKALWELQQTKKIFIGVNQAIINEDEIQSYFDLKKELQAYNIAIYPSIAYDAENALYSNKLNVDPALSFKPFGKFSNNALQLFFKQLIQDGKEVNNFQERLVDKYHLKGLYNRMVNNKSEPTPRCVALNNHLRLLPNGDIPVCLYNGKIIGNVKNTDFKSLWFSEEAKKQRKWVAKCPGCWQSCESAVNSIYTGDIWRSLTY